MDTAIVTVLSAPQFHAAHALAAAHGHEWGGLEPRTALALNQVGGLELLARVVRAQNGDLWPGIDRPHLDEEGTVVHTTASGRLRWEVCQDGYARLIVSRPEGDVLEACVFPPDASGVPAHVTVTHIGGEFLERHVGTLATAIAVLGPLGYGREQFGEMLAAAIEAVRPLQAPEPEPEPTPEPGPEAEPELDYYDAPCVVVSRGSRRPAVSDRAEA